MSLHPINNKQSRLRRTPLFTTTVFRTNLPTHSHFWVLIDFQTTMILDTTSTPRKHFGTTKNNWSVGYTPRISKWQETRHLENGDCVWESGGKDREGEWSIHRKSFKEWKRVKFITSNIFVDGVSWEYTWFTNCVHFVNIVRDCTYYVCYLCSMEVNSIGVIKSHKESSEETLTTIKSSRSDTKLSTCWRK